MKSMTSAPDPCPTPLRTAAVPILCLFVAGLYANAIRNGFVFDDAYQVLNNPWIRDFGHFREIFTTQVWAFAGRESNYYRPLMHVVFAALYVPFGPEAWVFHLVNVVLHGFSTVMVFLITSRILQDRAIGASRFGPSAALASGLIFAAHPIHTEAVAWISGLPDLACAAFYLAGVYMFLKASAVADRWTIPHALGAVCCLASALFKEPGLTLPGVVVLLDLAMRPRRRDAGFWATRYAFLVAACGVYLGLRFGALGGFAPGASGQGAGPATMIAGMGSAAWAYIGMVVAPFRLNAFHTFDPTAGMLGTAVLVVLPLLLGFSVWKRSVRWTVAVAIFLLPLLPALLAPALLPGLDNPWAERYVYLPSAGLVFGVGATVGYFHGVRVGLRRLATAGLAVVLVALSLATIQRNAVWRNDLILWADTVRKSPDSWAAHSYLGHALFKNGDIEGAIEQYGQAISMNPGFSEAHLNLGVALAVIGRHDAAVTAYDRSLKLNPSNAIAHVNLSISLAALGRMEQALGEAERAIAIDAYCAKAYGARGIALGNLGHFAEAAESFRRAVELDPGDRNSRANLERAKQRLTNGN